MASVVESALARTEAERTARFRSANLRGGPRGRLVRFGGLASVTEGIVDFEHRRAIFRLTPRRGGLVRQALRQWTPDQPLSMLSDGPSLSLWLLGNWKEPQPRLSSQLPRQPLGLTLLDLLRPESIVDVTEIVSERPAPQPTTHYALKLDVDRLDWPEPDWGQTQFRKNALVPSLVRPQGTVPAEIWIDGTGRLRRFSYRTTTPKRSQAFWPTTELWDFGAPRPVEDWRTQPAIDPVKMAYPDIA